MKLDDEKSDKVEWNVQGGHTESISAISLFKNSHLVSAAARQASLWNFETKQPLAILDQAAPSGEIINRVNIVENKVTKNNKKGGLRIAC